MANEREVDDMTAPREPQFAMTAPPPLVLDFHKLKAKVACQIWWTLKQADQGSAAIFEIVVTSKEYITHSDIEFSLNKMEYVQTLIRLLIIF